LTLRTHGLAKREAVADADADAEAFFYNGYYNPYSYSPFYNAYNAFYNPYYYNPYYNPYTIPATAPAAVVPAVKPVEVKAVPATPIVHHVAPVPVVARAPIVEPIVEETVKPVTYTHLGAHPLTNPATILEKTSQVVGHKVY